PSATSGRCGPSWSCRPRRPPVLSGLTLQVQFAGRGGRPHPRVCMPIVRVRCATGVDGPVERGPLGIVVGMSPLAEWLRARSDEALVALLRARPDLATPPPADTSVLATRVGVRSSVARACEDLDAFALSTLEA